jgi:methyl coenzyme M reductase subunit C
LPEILRIDGYVVCVYCEGGARHHLPHCHVKWQGKEAVVSLPILRLIVGDAVPAAGMQIVAENIALLIQEWERLNPSRDLAQKRQGHRAKRAKK